METSLMVTVEIHYEELKLAGTEMEELSTVTDTDIEETMSLTQDKENNEMMEEGHLEMAEVAHDRSKQAMNDSINQVSEI